MKFNFKAKKIKSKAVALLLCFALMSALVSCGDAQDVPNTEVSTETGAQTSTENETVTENETTNGPEADSESESASGSESTSESESVADSEKPTKPTYLSTTPSITASSVPAYTGKAYVALNNNQPSFSTDNLAPISYEYYSELDLLGRCGVVFACIGKDIMPTEDRGSIGSVKPTGWQTVKYDIVDGKYLYNRCHLIGFQLTGENANTKNLITGTRQLNIKGMLPFENMVADYVKETGNHVMYRVTPVFEGKNLVAKGVQIEAYSIEDDGEGICFNVFAYNVQDGIEINYANGNSALIEAQPSESESESSSSKPDNDKEMVWIPKTGKKYHSDKDCSNMNNPTEVTKDEAEDLGYEPCKKCYK